MTNIKSEERQRSKNKTEMERTYNSAEWLLREKVEQLDHLMFKLHQEARTLGVETDYIQRYMQEKLIMMIDEVAEKREIANRKGTREKKKKPEPTKNTVRKAGIAINKQRSTMMKTINNHAHDPMFERILVKE